MFRIGGTRTSSVSTRPEPTSPCSTLWRRRQRQSFPGHLPPKSLFLGHRAPAPRPQLCRGRVGKTRKKPSTPAPRLRPCRGRDLPMPPSHQSRLPALDRQSATTALHPAKRRIQGAERARERQPKIGSENIQKWATVTVHSTPGRAWITPIIIMRRTEINAKIDSILGREERKDSQ